MLVQHHNSDYLLQLVKDQFDRLYAGERDSAPKFVALAIHPYISGQPHRMKYLEAIYDYVNGHEGVVHWNGEQILDWYQGTKAPSPLVLEPSWTIDSPMNQNPNPISSTKRPSPN